MTSIAILGTSHVGALKAGWDALRAGHEETSVRFFAGPAALFRKFTFQGRSFGYFGTTEKSRIGTERINGACTIDLSTADVIVLAGVSLGFPKLAGVVSRCDIDGLSTSGRKTLLTSSAFRAISNGIAKDTLSETPSPAWTGTPVFALPKPLMAASETEPVTPAQIAWARASERGDAWIRALEMHTETGRAELASRSIHLIDQPAETRSDAGFTRSEYSWGPLKLVNTTDSSGEDRTHMNAKFGTIVMADLLRALAAQRAA